MSLPSPWATVKSSESPTPAKSPAEKTAQKSSGQADQKSLALEVLRGRNLEQSGDLDKARKVYEDLRRKSPENTDVAHRLGVVADRQRRHGEAESLFLEALQKEPRNAELLADLGYCYFLQGKLIKAESALSKATTLDPNNPRHRNNLGLVVGHLGRYDEALQCFRTTGTEADAYFNLAFIYAAQEKSDKAKQCFQFALGVDPTHTRARDALRSFDEYDRLPPESRDEELLAEDGVRYVPYIEPGEAEMNDPAVRPATAEMPLPTSREAGRATRSLQLEARGMLNRNMQSQRNDPPVTDGVEL
jgi:tetratricopeptide (TPR) repeat protein